MRSRSIISIVGFCALSAIVLMVVGCSDDDPVSPPVTGDNNTIANPQFSAVQSQVNDFVGSTIGLVNDGFSMTGVKVEVLDEIVFGPEPFDSSNYIDDWRIFFLMQAGTQIYGLDSIQFLKNGVPQATIAGMDEIRYKHYYRVAMDDTTVTYVNSDSHSDMRFTNLDDSVATVTGSYNLVIESKYVSADSTVWQDYDIQAALTSLTVNATSGWSGGCPASGSVSVTVEATYQKDAEQAVSTNWEFSLSFTDGMMETDVVLGTDSATYSSQVCTVN